MVSERKINLKTNDDGNATLTTPPMRGKLDAVIINSDVKVEVLIQSELGYDLFHSHEIYGPQYIPLRARPKDTEAHGWNFEATSFNLNENLIITIYGPDNRQANVNFIFRFE